MKNKDLRKNKILNAIFILALFLLQSNAYATLPHGYSIVNGNVVFDYNHQKLDITAPNNSIINWNSYSIGPNNSVTYIQPNSSSVVLNRVVGVDPSYIFWRYSSNGRLFFFYPFGSLFGGVALV